MPKGVDGPMKQSLPTEKGQTGVGKTNMSTVARVAGGRVDSGPKKK